MGGKCCKKYFCCCCGCFRKIFCCCCTSNAIGGRVPEDHLQWLLNHTSYDEKEIKELYLGKIVFHFKLGCFQKEFFFKGFQLDFPLGGISRREFEKCFTTKNAQKMSDVVFR